MNNISVVILAAGIGSRMKSSLPKAMHALGGVPMVDHLIHKATALNPKEIVAVIGEDMPEMEKHLDGRVKIAYQKQRLGSGHGVLAAKEYVSLKKGVVLILYADTPLVSEEVLAKLVNGVELNKYDVGLIAFEKHQANAYGKLVIDSHKHITKIVEYADASEEEKKIFLCNSGVMAIDASKIWQFLESIDNKNKKQEYYLTDAIAIANKHGSKCGYIIDKEANLQGANSKLELAMLEETFQNQQRQKFLEAGVQLIDPKNTYFSLDTKIGKDVIIHPNVYIGPKVVVGDNVEIKPMCVIEGVKIGKGTKIGPFARIRPETILEENTHIGNFVEVKKSHIKTGAKINHLSYIGDAIVGSKTNIGAGTITCNYNGKEKFNTIIGDNAFIGSNTALIAPVTIGDGATIGAGSTITKDVPEKALAVTRGQQRNIEGYNKN
jgi:bifunctional UDP-N-acetylglucosamine pyrophosphorylase/glucosamine-1-phosphate N-acetyltransferase